MLSIKQGLRTAIIDEGFEIDPENKVLKKDGTRRLSILEYIDSMK